jgi:hypothetical protein
LKSLLKIRNEEGEMKKGKTRLIICKVEYSGFSPHLLNEAIIV